MILAAAILSLSAQASAAPGPASTIDWLRSQRLELVEARGNYSGTGWDRIVDDGANAQFFMIGEQHASGSIAKLETAFHRALAGRGFTHAALEVGPYSTRFAEQRIRERPGSLAGYLAAPNHGFAIPFLFLAEETAMAEQIVATSPDKGPVLWGVDQEFIGSGPVIAELLGARAKTQLQREAVAAWKLAADKERLYVAKAPDSMIDGLERAFAGDAEAMSILAELRSSRAIYRPFLGSGEPIYPANLARETGMKRKFQAAFEASERRLGAAPKVFLKFGGYHAMRGLSGTDVPSFANFLAEWGGSRGFGLVNLLVDCIGGEALDPQTGKAAPCESYIGTDTLLEKAVAGGPQLQVYDLKALRPTLSKHKDLDAKTRRTILAFDYYVAVQNGRAATPIGAIAAR